MQANLFSRLQLAHISGSLVMRYLLIQCLLDHAKCYFVIEKFGLNINNVVINYLYLLEMIRVC
jgi:hypothetical protein